MRIRIDDPAALPDLVEELSSRIYAVITTVGDDEVELWLLGSLTTAADRGNGRASAEPPRRRHAKVWILADEEP